MVLPRWTKGAATATFAVPASVGLMTLISPSPVVAAPLDGPELRILSPRQSEAVAGNSFNLDVSFRSRPGSPVTAAELWVDGERWVRRELNTPQIKNVLSFAVDATTLTPGAHKVQVKVYDSQGNASATTLEVVSGSAASSGGGAFGGPEMAFVGGQNNAKVQGTIEIGLDVKDRSGQNPYVSFFIDKEFKTLKNYPPYNYNWDTTTVANGWHTVEAMGYVEASNKSTTKRMRVLVDNPGGNTVRMNEIPDLATKIVPKAAAAATARTLTIPLPKRIATKTAPVKRIAVAPRLAIEPNGTVLATPASLGLRSVTNAVTSALELRAMTPKARAASVKSAQSVVQKTPIQPLAAAPVRVAQGYSVVKPVQPSVTPRVGRATASAALPRLSSPVRALLGMPEGSFQVAFDGDRIAFDVQPRVEKGLPLAPFRQIFEHTGGRVDWVPSTGVVRAVNADREIVIHVGKKDARVNDQSVTMEKAAFIESGRTIVPLSFVGKSLDVNVQYDPATGRLLITSK